MRCIFTLAAILLHFTLQARPGLSKPNLPPDTSQYHFLEIKKLMSKGGYILAIQHLERLKAEAPDSYQCHWLLGKSYLEMQQFDSAMVNLSRLSKLKAKKPEPFALFYLSYCQYRLGQHKQALESLQKFEAGRPPFQAGIWADAKKMKLELADPTKPETEAIRFEMDTTFQFPNSAYADFSPLMVGDSAFIFSALRQDSLVIVTPGEPNFNTVQLYRYKIRPDGKFDELSTLRQLNKRGYYTGNGSYSKDGKRFFFSRCIETNGKLKCAIYEALVLADGGFGRIRKLNDRINKKKYSSSQPFFASIQVNGAEQGVLFFVSDRKSGFGKNDIWYSLYNQKKKRFGAAFNAGMQVNSAGNDESPFLTSQGNLFYFSSDGFAGFGGKDIFVATATGLTLKNRRLMPKPINSSGDDQNFFLREDGKSGFLASNRKGAYLLDEKYCCADIFRFAEPSLLQPVVAREPEPEPVVLAKADPSPILPLPPTPEEPERKPLQVVELDEKAASLKPQAKDDPSAKRVSADERSTISRKVFFPKNRSAIDPKLARLLNRILDEIVSQHPKEITFKGFADYKGNLAYNQKLAGKRAQSVLRYCKAKRPGIRYQVINTDLSKAVRTEDQDMLSLDRYVEIFWK